MDPFSADPFASDPFFSSGAGMMGGSLFGMGGIHNSMMSGHFDRMSSMMSQMHSGSMFGDFDDQQQQQQKKMENGKQYTTQPFNKF